MISNADISLRDLMQRISEYYPTKRLEDSGFTIERPRANRTTAYVRLWKLSSPDAQYEEGDILPFPIGPQTRGFLIEFNDLRLLREAVPFLCNRDDVAVDDDHGMIASGKEFVTKLQNSEALTWLAPDYET